MPTPSQDIKKLISIVNSKESPEVIKVNKLNKIFRQNPVLANQVAIILNKYSDKTRSSK